MTDRQRSRRALSIFVGVSCAVHALVLFCVPVGPTGETMGERALRQVKVQGIEFVKVIRPKPKPKPRVVHKPKPAPRIRRIRVHRVRSIVRRAPKPEPLEARVMPPPKPGETVAPPPVEEPVPEPETQPVETAKTTPPPEPVLAPEPTPQPVETPEMLAMAPQPIPSGPRSDPTAVDRPLEPGRRITATEHPRTPSAADLGSPEVTRPAPASGGDAKRTPQIGLQAGLENRSALPGTANRLGAPESVAGPGGPLPVVVSPNPGGSPRVAALPKPGPTGPVVRRGVPGGALDAPSAAPGPCGPAGKRSPGPDIRRSVGTGPSHRPAPGSGESPGPAGPGQPIALITSPKSTLDAPPRGASGRSSGAGGGGAGDIVLAGGGGSDEFLAGGPGGPASGADESGSKSRPALGSPWGGDSGEPLYARGGTGGEGLGGPGGGGGGGTGTGIGDGAGPGSGLGEPILVASAGPGGGYGYGDTALPLGWPDGTETTGAPGYPWLKPGLGRAGGGGEGLFGGPHGRGSGGGFPGVGDKLTPGFGGIPGGTGLDIPPPSAAGGGGGGGGDEAGGPGLFGPLTVGGPGDGVGGPRGLVALARRGLGLPLLPSSITQPLLGIHGGFGGPSGSGTETAAVGKGSPGGIYADLVGTFDIPVGVTNSDYNTDEVSVLNLLGVMRERTNVRVTIDNRYVPITYDAIKDAPMLWVSGHKPLTWTDEERAALRKYVENGGTLLIEDCHGPFNQVMPNEVRRIFGKELEPVPMDDELFRSFYVIDELPAGDVQERLPIRGLRMPDGRLGVIYSSNDYSDAWKVPRGSYVADDQKEQAYRMGINWYVYILAHWRRGQPKTEATPKVPAIP